MDSNTAAYEKLIDAMNARGLTLPAVKCDEFFTLVEELFTPEEAVIASAMPLGFSTINKIAARLPGRGTIDLAAQLETMADRFLIQIRQSNGGKLYELLPFVPGITELMFMGGFVDERSRKVYNLVIEYITALEKMAALAPPPESTPAEPARLITVEEDVSHKSAILPLKEICQFLMKTDYIAAGICMCRRQGELRNNPCKAPLNNCLILGKSAKFAVERGFAMRITKEDAVKRMKEADKAGLIHSYTNNPNHYINLLCNCCQCHCAIARGIKNSPVPGQVITARYLAEIDEDSCTACEVCIERCQMEALKIADGKLTCDPIRCLGCGLCLPVCPTEALSLKPLEASKIPLGKC
ncbi:MAG: 4Fe-4S binding protein [Dehalococcoidia bacterium]|nr:4Fe-4S binding protein [Dehalococcoidia bacterium]